MATAVNPITGNLIKTKGQSQEYRSNYDQIDWSKKSESSEPEKKEDAEDPQITSK